MAKSLLPTGRLPKPSLPINAGKVAFVGRQRQQELGGGAGNPIRKSPIIPPDNPLNRAAIHRNKPMMTPTPEGY